jgi:hypothetical protein
MHCSYASCSGEQGHLDERQWYTFAVSTPLTTNASHSGLIGCSLIISKGCSGGNQGAFTDFGLEK